MNPTTQQKCLTSDEIQALLHEQISEAEEQRIQRHVDSCSACQQRLEQAAAAPSLWQELRDNTVVRGLDSDSDHSDQRIQLILNQLGPTDDPQMLGRLGNYEIVGVIGQGSTGIVLKAFERRLNRFVAIKVLSPAFSSIGAARKRFEREGQAVASVLHQNVVPIYAVDDFQGLMFIVMQYVPGMSLLQRIEKNGPLDTCEVTRIGLQIARGLAAAHAQGLVHRDVKPANVILEETVDRAMVTDFGLARVADDASMTRSGTIAGTPQYMSPEQAQGNAIDARSDLFSLGALLYTACTARPPFRAETLIGVINRVCQESPRPIRETNPRIEPWLTELIGKLLEKSPDQRFQSAEELAAALAEELAYLQNPTSTPKPDRRWQRIDQNKAEKPGRQNQRSQSVRMAWLVAAMGLLITAASLIGTPQWRSAIWSSLTGTPPGEQDSLKDHSPDGSSSSKAPSTNNSLARDPQSAWQADSPQDTEIKDDPTITWIATNQEWSDDTDPTFDQKLEQSFPFVPGGTLTVLADRDDVIVRPSDLSDRITVTLMRRVAAGSQPEAAGRIKNHQFSFDKSDNDLVISTALSEAYSAMESDMPIQRVLWRISVPKSFHAQITCKQGDITIGELTGSVEAETGSGDINFARIDGPVKGVVSGGSIRMMEGSTGEVDLLAICGNLFVANVEDKARLRTSLGHVWLGENPGKVGVQTSGGDIKVTSLLGVTRAHAQNGNVFARLHGSPQEGSRFSATRGDVTFELDPDAALTLQADGNVDADGLEFQPVSDDPSDARRSQCQFNNGETIVQSTSSTGTVYVSINEQADPNDLDGRGGPGLGGSGLSSIPIEMSEEARQKTRGKARAGALVTVELENPGTMDGYTLYLPQSHAENSDQYPILVYLQGGFGVGGEVSAINNWGLPRLIRDQNDLSTERNRLLLDSFIVICPHIQQGNYYDHPKTVQKIIDDVAQQYRGDLSKVYLTGLSRGGHGSWGLASKLPNTFAAIAPIAGNANGVDDFRSLKDVSIWIAHNSSDSVVSFDHSQRAIKEFEKANRKSFTTTGPNFGEIEDLTDQPYLLTTRNSNSHDAWTDIYTSPQFYQWLLKQSRD